VRYGVSIPPFTDPATLVGLAEDAESAGWDGVFLWDHLRWSSEHRLDVHDPWVTLGAMAQVTERVILGPVVTPLPRRRPWVVAKQLTTLDHLSGGRALLGVGLGEPPDADFADLGEAVDARVRAAILDEGLDIIDGLLRGDRVDHHGEHFTVTADLRPAPVQKPRPPIWVAAVAPNQRPLARARRWDGIVPLGAGTNLSPEEIAAYVGEPPRPDWDVVASWSPGVPADEYADAGATWLLDSTWPVGDWVGEFVGQVRRGPA
jgi:alkanesulfonate monooxygenase SsuD/methylene tetrahydromethanopterin reductase-like flavin-dependent oxidoreductase (luciferase family)